MKKLFLLLFLLSTSLFAIETGPANSVMRVPSGGGRPKYGAVDLSQGAAVTNVLSNNNGGADVSNTGIAASVTSNILTIALKDRSGADPTATSPSKIIFRSATLSSGTYAQVSTTGALSLALGTAVSLGMKTAVPNYIYVFALNNAGTVVLGASLHPYWSDAKLQNSSTTGTSNQVLYTTVAQTSVPVRLLGRVKATWTSGTGWSAITEISSVPFDMPAITCRGYKAAVESYTSSSSPQSVSMTGVTNDTLNGFTSSTYTVAAPGQYLVIGRVTFQLGSVNYDIFSGIKVNGTTVASHTDNGSAWGAGAYYPAGGVQWIGNLNAGDTVNLYAAQENSTATAYNLAGEGAGVSTYLTLSRIGF